MSARTPQQVEAEIAALEKCKTYVPKYPKFGGDNHAQIDLQIEALRDGWDTTTDEFSDLSWDDQNAINDALEWQAGNNDEAPSAGWDVFKPKGLNGRS